MCKFICCILILSNLGSCGSGSPEKVDITNQLKCPLGHFGLSAGESADNIVCRFEAPLTPCENQGQFIGENAQFFVIKNDGTGKAELNGTIITLFSHPCEIKAGTKFWSQQFYNDSMKIKIHIQNDSFAERKILNRITYSSRMIAELNDTTYNFNLFGVCSPDNLFK